MSIAEFLDQQKQQGSTQLLEGSHSMQHEEGQRSNVEHISGFEQENEEETNEEPTGLLLASYCMLIYLSCYKLLLVNIIMSI